MSVSSNKDITSFATGLALSTNVAQNEEITELWFCAFSIVEFIKKILVSIKHTNFVTAIT